MRVEAAASNFSKDIPRVPNGRGCEQLLAEKDEVDIVLKHHKMVVYRWQTARNF
jgi:hypothetical protein